MYYLSQKPIPAETQTVIRGLCARTQEEQNTVEIILKEFFTLTELGWVHNRCDREIAVYQSRCDHNREAGKLGGRPKKTQMVISGNQVGLKTKPKITLTSNQEPLTINQVNLEPLSDKSDVAVSQFSKQENAKKHAEAVIDFLNLKTGRKYRPTKSNLDPILARLREGYTLQDIRTVTMRKVNDWLTDEKMNEYLRPSTLYTARNFNSYAGILT